MASFSVVTQNVFGASPGQLLSDVVDYTATGVVGPWTVTLRDASNGAVISSDSGFSTIFNPTINGSLPHSTDGVIMPDVSLSLYLQLEVNTLVADTRTLQTIGTGGAGPSKTTLLVAAGGIASAILIGAAVYMLSRR